MTATTADLPQGIDLSIFVPVLSAVIAAGAAVYVAVLSVRSRRAEQDETRRLRQAEFYRRQIDELYGEMLMLRKASRALWLRLKGDDVDFRMKSSIRRIKANPKDKIIAEQIIQINDRLATLIVTKASLLTRLPPPKSFVEFLDHQRALAALWKANEDAAPDGLEQSFPRCFDADIRSAVRIVKSRLRAVEKSAPPRSLRTRLGGLWGRLGSRRSL